MSSCAKAENPDAKLEKGKKRANSGSRESLSRKMKDLSYLSSDTSKTDAGGSAAKSRDPEVDELQLVKDLCELTDKVTRALQCVQMEESTMGASSSNGSAKGGPSGSSKNDDKDLSTRYINALKELQFVSCDIDSKSRIIPSIHQ